MFVLFVIFSVLGAIGLFIGMIANFSESKVVSGIVCIALCAGCVYSAIYCGDTDRDVFRHAADKPIVEYGVLKEVDAKGVTVDQQTVQFNKNLIKDATGYKIGQFVKVEYVSGDFGNYIKSIKSIDVKE